jgi:hypothetical protein
MRARKGKKERMELPDDISRGGGALQVYYYNSLSFSCIICRILKPMII